MHILTKKQSHKTRASSSQIAGAFFALFLLGKTCGCRCFPFACPPPSELSCLGATHFGQIDIGRTKNKEKREGKKKKNNRKRKTKNEKTKEKQKTEEKQKRRKKKNNKRETKRGKNKNRKMKETTQKNRKNKDEEQTTKLKKQKQTTQQEKNEQKNSRSARGGGGRSSHCFFSLHRRKFRSFLYFWKSSRGSVAPVQGNEPPKVRVCAGRGKNKSENLGGGAEARS